MTRIIKNERSGPYPVAQDDLGKGGKAWVCGCGLSSNKPFCDNSHATARKLEQPGKLYYYPDNNDDNPPREVDPQQLGLADAGGNA